MSQILLKDERTVNFSYYIVDGKEEHYRMDSYCFAKEASNARYEVDDNFNIKVYQTLKNGKEIEVLPITSGKSQNIPDENNVKSAIFKNCVGGLKSLLPVRKLCQ